MILSVFFDVKKQDDIEESITDGLNDGGIDFVYFDEDNVKLIIAQSKYTASLAYGDIKNEFDKICDTINNFRQSNTGSYNERLRQILQNAIDRLPDDEQDNIEIYLFTSANSANINDPEKIIKRLNNDIPELKQFSVFIYSGEEIKQKIVDRVTPEPVEKYTIEIDKARNFLTYETEHARGIVINIKSDSLTRMFNKFQTKGLFDMNIRRYVGNRLIDDKIKETLDANRDDFWFLNNGIVIVCENYVITGRKIELFNFSIVNGGQTTYLIGKYKGSN